MDKFFFILNMTNLSKKNLISRLKHLENGLVLGNFKIEIGSAKLHLICLFYIKIKFINRQNKRKRLQLRLLKKNRFFRIIE